MELRGFAAQLFAGFLLVTFVLAGAFLFEHVEVILH